jgi:hypothetical protein
MFKEIIRFNMIFILLLSGCVTLTHTEATTEDTTVEKHNLFMQQFFNGTVAAYGLVLNRDAKSTRQFKRIIKGVWKGNDGFMSEKVYYSDGQQAEREWCIHLIDNNHFAGVATNVVGVIQGEQHDNAIHMLYHPNGEIYFADNLHTKGQAFASYRSLPFQSIYSLLTASSWYGGIRAATSLERQNIKPALKNTITYTYKDIGAFCQHISKDWQQRHSDSNTNLTNNVWMYKVNKNIVIEKITIQDRNLEVGEVIASLQRIN